MVAVPMTNNDADEFYSILSAVQETPKGRWFLEEFARRNRVADTDTLLEAINTLKAEAAETLKAATTPSDATTVVALRRELEEMSATIRSTRAAIASIKPEDDGNNRIMMASEELDAIVSATERATSEILAGAERIQEISDKFREQGGDEDLCDEIESHATSIFMACSFQDITGQRTSKVVGVLKYLEHRLNYMVSLWDGSTPETLTDIDSTMPTDQRPDAYLITGPQAEDVAPSQDQIDDIFQDMGLLDEEDDLYVGGPTLEFNPDKDDIAESAPETPQARKPALKTVADDLDFAPVETSSKEEPATKNAGTGSAAEIAQDDVDALFN